MQKAIYKALIVEDNRLMFKVIEAYLAQYEITCIPAYSGEEALIKFKNEEFDIVFMDIYMPEMDGYETTELMRAMERTENKVYTPIVALTAEAMGTSKQKAFEVGMDDYLSKPLQRHIVELVLNKYVFKKI